MEQREV